MKKDRFHVEYPVMNLKISTWTILLRWRVGQTENQIFMRRPWFQFGTNDLRVSFNDQRCN